MKANNKLKLAQYLQETTGVVVNPASMFDIQVKLWVLPQWLLEGFLSFLFVTLPNGKDYLVLMLVGTIAHIGLK